jgi:hypothetical protein
MAGGHLALFINETKPADETLKLVACIQSVNFRARSLQTPSWLSVNTAPVLLARRKVKHTSC